MHSLQMNGNNNNRVVNIHIDKSTNIVEVIRTVLNFFFYDKISQAQKSTKSTKSTKNTKSIKAQLSKSTKRKANK